MADGGGDTGWVGGDRQGLSRGKVWGRGCPDLASTQPSVGDPPPKSWTCFRTPERPPRCTLARKPRAPLREEGRGSAEALRGTAAPRPQLVPPSVGPTGALPPTPTPAFKSSKPLFSSAIKYSCQQSGLSLGRLHASSLCFAQAFKEQDAFSTV